jgi:thiamine biosynthesis lipoprotein
VRIALPPRIDASALADRDPGAAIGEMAGETMGTTWSVRFATQPHSDPGHVRSRVEERLAGIVAQMSHWDPESLLSRFNDARAGEWATLPADFAAVIAAGIAVADISDGAFDPAIGRLVDLWGFGPKGPSSPPTAAMVDEARKLSGWRRLAFDAPARRIRQPGGLGLDLSGIAKGHAVDAVADLLGELGLRHALVEIGGELVGRGMRPDGEPWWVDLEIPPDTGCAPLRIALHGLAVATSGSYRRGLHTIDPRTGWPVDNGIVSLSVIASSALQADAWATALTVLGPDNGLALATEHGVAARIIRMADGMATEILTPSLIAMMSD